MKRMDQKISWFLLILPYRVLLKKDNIKSSAIKIKNREINLGR